MEWVEKTGRTVAEAKEQALDQLGVTERDAEVVVLEEPRTGLFGRVRGEARVRARVRPAEPRPKRQRPQRERNRRGRPSGPSGRGGARSGSRAGTQDPQPSSRAEAEVSTGESAGANGGGGRSTSSRRRRRRRAAGARSEDSGVPAADGQGPGAERAEGGSNRRTETARRPRRDENADEEGTVSEGVTLQEQGEVAREFIEGLLDRFGLEATIEVRELDEQTVEVAAKGEGLGLLVGPKGATLASLQDVTRTVVQRRFPHRTDRILIDVAGYRERRAAALQRFAQQVSAEVLETGAERALEPMSPADRKVVHDTVAEIEGVGSSSQGEEPHRFVVIAPQP